MLGRQCLKRGFVVENFCWKAIDKIGSSKDSLGPKTY